MNYNRGPIWPEKVSLDNQIGNWLINLDVSLKQNRGQVQLRPTSELFLSKCGESVLEIQMWEK